MLAQWHNEEEAGAEEDGRPRAQHQVAQNSIKTAHTITRCYQGRSQKKHSGFPLILGEVLRYFFIAGTDSFTGLNLESPKYDTNVYKPTRNGAQKSYPWSTLKPFVTLLWRLF